ncbi:MAG: hypothetical protein K0M40_19480 [Prolixibacteraceae bacterium]|nr:hypothetical protein [Prolixibacteraceae bacterium]
MKQLASIPAGMIFLVFAILIDRFLPQNNFLDFLAGMFTGLSIVLNVRYVLAIAKNKQLKLKAS